MALLTVTLLIAAAADLAPLEQELSQAFEKKTGIHLRFTLGSSGLLAQQIENGAPFDVYLSANEAFVKKLTETGILDGASVRTYALGRLGLWGVKDLQALASPSLRHVAIPNPKHAPYGVAAEEALRRLGLLEGLRSKIVYGENVRQTYQYARSGNAEAAITSWTLVLNEGGVLLPDTLHDPIRQSGAVVKSSRNAAEARAFLDFLASDEGRAILRRYGLSEPRARDEGREKLLP